MNGREGKWVSVALFGFLGAYIAVEAYYAGQREAKRLVSGSGNLPTETDETDSPSVSQPDETE